MKLYRLDDYISLLKKENLIEDIQLCGNNELLSTEIKKLLIILRK